MNERVHGYIDITCPLIINLSFILLAGIFPFFFHLYFNFELNDFADFPTENRVFSGFLSLLSICLYGFLFNIFYSYRSPITFTLEFRRFLIPRQLFVYVPVYALLMAVLFQLSRSSFEISRSEMSSSASGLLTFFLITVAYVVFAIIFDVSDSSKYRLFRLSILLLLAALFFVIVAGFGGRGRAVSIFLLLLFLYRFGGGVRFRFVWFLSVGLCLYVIFEFLFFSRTGVTLFETFFMITYSRLSGRNFDGFENLATVYNYWLVHGFELSFGTNLFFDVLGDIGFSGSNTRDFLMTEVLGKRSYLAGRPATKIVEFALPFGLISFVGLTYFSARISRLLYDGSILKRGGFITPLFYFVWFQSGIFTFYGYFFGGLVFLAFKLFVIFFVIFVLLLPRSVKFSVFSRFNHDERL